MSDGPRPTVERFRVAMARWLESQRKHPDLFLDEDHYASGFNDAIDAVIAKLEEPPRATIGGPS